MYSHRQSYFGHSTKQYGLFNLIDIFDKESFIREYILDNVFVCIFMYILFYFAVWYAHKVIMQVERKNREMSATVERNKSKLDDIIKLKNKREEYDEIVGKTKLAHQTTAKQLDEEIKKLNSELTTTMSKLTELERFLTKWKLWKNYPQKSTKKTTVLDDELSNANVVARDSLENVKILDPSFPPSQPFEPAPRKFGVFARPPTATMSHNPSGKIGFK